MEVSATNVLDWNQRPKRKRGPPPKTYWEEFVETDTWYLKEIVRDVPEEEMQAALEDTDWDDDDAGEEGDESESDEQQSSDGDFEPDDQETSSEEEDDDEDDSGSATDSEADSEESNYPERWIEEAAYSPRSPDSSPPDSTYRDHITLAIRAANDTPTREASPSV